MFYVSGPFRRILFTLALTLVLTCTIPFAFTKVTSKNKQGPKHSSKALSVSELVINVEDFPD